MNQEILIVDADSSQSSHLCCVLNRHRFPTLPLMSLGELETQLSVTPRRTAIIDLDSLPANKDFFKRMRSAYPHVNFLVLSERSFHPELREALAEQIFACVKKPVDPEEILFLLRSIESNRNG